MDDVVDQVLKGENTMIDQRVPEVEQEVGRPLFADMFAGMARCWR